jgi:hypothetical protein
MFLSEIDSVAAAHPSMPIMLNVTGPSQTVALLAPPLRWAVHSNERASASAVLEVPRAAMALKAERT